MSFICRQLRSATLVTYRQGVTKRCRLSWLTSSALVYEPKCGGRGRVAGSQPMSTAVHRSPNKLWRSNSIFNLCLPAKKYSFFCIAKHVCVMTEYIYHAGCLLYIDFRTYWVRTLIAAAYAVQSLLEQLDLSFSKQL
jgi:hypothetical protein